MNETGQPDSEQNLEAPAELMTALKDASRRNMFVPSHIDQTIFKAAKQHLTKPAPSSRSSFRNWLLWLAMATACAVVILTIRLLTMERGDLKETIRSDYAREDLNHDGQVDILDSFALARQLKNSKSLPTAVYDINGDGVVDVRDVVLIATRAVKLEKGKGS